VKKSRQELPPEERAIATQTLQKAEAEERLGRGKKLTRLKRKELLASIRLGLANAMHPAAIKAACAEKYNISRHTVEKYLLLAQQESLKQVGYYRSQIQELCQKALVDIVKKNKSESAVVRAVQMLDNIFDIRVVPEDTAESQRLIAENAMSKMDKMNPQELQQFAEHLRTGGDKLTADMLLPWGDAKDDGLTPKAISAQRRRKNRRALK
jgi:ribonuclease HII